MKTAKSVSRFGSLGAIALLGLALAGMAPSGVALAAAGPTTPPLVTASWLKAHLHSPNQVIVEVYDVAAQRPAYEAAHIPGAVFTGFLNDGWREARGGVPGLLPPPARIAEVIGHFGIGNDTRVILVPGGRTRGDFNAAARIFWTLRIEGQNNVSILNGGDHAWLADPSAPIATGAVAPQPAVFVPHPAPGYLATTATVHANLTSHAAQLVDARPPAQFEGRVKSRVDARAGTIPGAHNLPYSALLTADHEGVRPMPDLTAALHRAGVNQGASAITFCNTGHLASTDWFVLREVFANPKVKLYDGSMTAWSRDASLPMQPGTSAF